MVIVPSGFWVAVVQILSDDGHVLCDPPLGQFTVCVVPCNIPVCALALLYINKPPAIAVIIKITFFRIKNFRLKRIVSSFHLFV